MKKFIKWLAVITGVAHEIEKEAYVHAGKHMKQYAYWYTGGLLVKGAKYDISNVLWEYPEWCLKKGAPHLFGNQFDQLRQKLWDLSERGKSIIVEENKSNES